MGQAQDDKQEEKKKGRMRLISRLEAVTYKERVQTKSPTRNHGAWGTLKLTPSLYVRATCLNADAVCVTFGQRVLRQGVAEMWDSVGIHAHEDADGNLTVEVLVFNPDWDEPLRIARIQSRPHDESCLTPLGCNLDHA